MCVVMNKIIYELNLKNIPLNPLVQRQCAKLLYDMHLPLLRHCKYKHGFISLLIKLLNTELTIKISDKETTLDLFLINVTISNFIFL